MVSLSGLGKGWITRGPLGINSSTLVNIATSTGKVSTSLITKPCVTRTVRILLPDGSPAAGSVVQMEWPGLEMTAFGRTHMPSEDAEKYEKFKKETWTARQAVTDEQGQVTLENRLPGKSYFQVFWADAKTHRPHWGTASFSLEEQEPKSPQDIQLTGK
jgi:hypothetical protein